MKSVAEKYIQWKEKVEKHNDNYEMLSWSSGWKYQMYGRNLDVSKITFLALRDKTILTSFIWESESEYREKENPQVSFIVKKQEEIILKINDEYLTFGSDDKGQSCNKLICFFTVEEMMYLFVAISDVKDVLILSNIFDSGEKQDARKYIDFLTDIMSVCAFDSKVRLEDKNNGPED